MIKFIAISLGCLVLAFIVWRNVFFYKYPKVKIINQSKDTIENISISGNGYDELIPLLKAGESRKLTLKPRGESSIKVKFDTPDGAKEKDELGYLSGQRGLFITITIQADYKVVSVRKTNKWMDFLIKLFFSPDRAPY